MKRMNVNRVTAAVTAGVFSVASLALGQDTSSSTGGWRRVGDSQPAPQISQSNPNPGNYPESTYPEQQPAQSPNYPPAQQNYPQAQQTYPQQNPQYSVPAPPPPQSQGGNGGSYQVPSQLSVPAGTYITVRVNQGLSSDHNQPGDAFSATLVRPIVANGVVLAEPGQTIGGRVAEAQKAGRVEGLSRLGVELTDVTLVDGQNLPVRTTLVSRTGNSSVGRDVAGVAGTTALGAAIGAAAGWGRGAAIGAGAGAAVGLLGVLVTRGQPSIIYPEQILTFRIEQPLTVATDRAPQAFRYVQPNEYIQPAYSQAPAYAAPAPGYGYAAAPYPYYGYGANPYYGYGYPYYAGGFSLYVGPGWGRGYYYGGRYSGGFGYRGGYRGGYRR